MTDTPTIVHRNRARAHYPSDVTTERRRRNAELTTEQQESIARVRAAAEKVAEADRALAAAHAARATVLRAEWGAHLSDLGATRIAREVGDDLIGEGTVRNITVDLRAAQRAND